MMTLLRESLKMEPGGHWGSEAYASLVSQLLGLLNYCPVAKLSSRLKCKHPRPMISSYRNIYGRYFFLIMVTRPSVFVTLKGKGSPFQQPVSSIYMWACPISADLANIFIYTEDLNENSFCAFAFINPAFLCFFQSTIQVAAWICTFWIATPLFLR